jgi:hypothetical protein
VVRVGDSRGAYRVLVVRPEGKTPLERPGRRQDNIKTDPQEVGWEDMGWIDLAQDRGRWWALLNTVMYLRLP